MPNKRSRALRRWMSKKHSFRQRWPFYLAMMLICVTSVAVVVLIMSGDEAPSRARTPAPATVPASIR